MPFTFSHPAIVLPLNYLPKKWFSLTGLIIGSLTPDFEYFLRMRIKSEYSHTLAGLFWFDLPLALLLSFIFHGLVRNHLIENLPVVLKSRFWAYQQFKWRLHFKKNWLVIATSILIGAASHVLWDGFTHDQGYFVKLIPSLTHKVLFFGQTIPILKILQHASTLMGALVIAYAIYQLPSNKPKKEKVNLTYWISIALLTLIIIVLKLAGGLKVPQIGEAIATVIAAIMASLVLTSLSMRYR